jgi:hypothetical protein
MSRLGSQVTMIVRGPQLVGREDQDRGALLELFRDEGIEGLFRAQLTKVSGVSRENIPPADRSRETGAR